MRAEHTVSERPSKPVWRSRSVVALGLVSLLNDAASDMVVPLLPAFLLTLGAGALALGWVEGVADFVASVLKLLVGRWADRARRYHPFVIAGYALATVARPFLAAATTALHVLAVRVTDRAGKGLRTAPRDAILAAAVPPHQRGAAFGLHRAMDHAGAVLGPLLAFVCLSFALELRTIFLLAIVPGMLALALVVFGVREPAKDAPAPEPAPEPAARTPRDGATLARFLVPVGLFTLGNASDAFLLLKAGAEDTPLHTLPLLWLALHVVKSATSVLGGRLADTWGRRPTILLGWTLYAAIYVGFAFAESQLAIWALFVAYGAHHGLSEAAEKALVSDLVGKARLGSGFGWYHFVVGALTLVASVLFGALWSAFDARTAFLTSAAIAIVAALALALLPGLPPRRAVSE